MTALPERIRAQFDYGPFPSVPLEQSPEGDNTLLFQHSWQTAYFLHYRRTANLTSGIRILDAGCGTGYRTLALAIANPGAHIIGIDLSPRSIELARQRLQLHACKDVQFEAMAIRDIPQLGQEFDYINCDDTLYLFSDLSEGFQELSAVLKPGGLLRANVHSALQRASVYRAQSVFKELGLFDGNPEAAEIELVQTFMGQLKHWVDLKRTTWKSEFATAKEDILMNYLFQGDQGFTLPEVFAALSRVHLDFVSMVNAAQWQLSELFEQPHILPKSLLDHLRHLPIPKRLALFELIHPVHRLLDFWCVKPGGADPAADVTVWDISTWAARWSTVRVSLHPLLRTEEFQKACIDCWRAHKPLVMTNYLNPGLNRAFLIDARSAVMLLPLIEAEAVPLLTLIKRSLELYPRDPETLELATPEMMLAELKNMLVELAKSFFVMLEDG